MAHLSLNYLGVEVELSVAERLLDSVRAALPPFAPSTVGGEGPVHVAITWNASQSCPQIGYHGTDYVCDPDPARLIFTIRRHLELLVVNRTSAATVFHAGSVAVERNGEIGAVLLVGHSGSGKSTLVSALADKGFVYLSDEYAPVMDGPRVLPYPRSVRVAAGGDGVESEFSPDRWRVATESVPILAVLLQHFGSEPALHRLAGVLAVSALMPHVVSSVAAAFARTASLCDAVPVFAWSRGDVHETDVSRDILDIIDAGAA